MAIDIYTVVTVDSEGRVVVPVGVDEAGSRVEVRLKDQKGPKLAAEMTPAEYAAFIDSIAGKWVGEFPEIDDPPPEPVGSL